uniref:J domain-containing protein n=2 Tax=Pyxicephalus adspersus TaxID=30357 RepID=A0AAV3BAD9_PYXAD|nr:TPA: hypothetical protein GDO54_001768 [Pyxicephalus adspersus]
MWVPSKMPQIAVPGARFYAQENGRRTRNNNGAQGSEVPLYATRTRYYDLLEVSGNATQSQIKTAYYKQSFRYHPDRNAGNEDATRRFGQVTEAYHVLGTTSLRKKYDRGILGPEDVRNARKPSGRSSSPSRKDTAGQKQTSSTSFSPAKPMFDFDAFYQAHYGEQLAREQFYKQRRAQMEKQKEEQRLAKQMNRMVDVSNVVFFLPFILLFLALKE